MSERLGAQFVQLEEDRQQLRLILSGMVEGVIALTADQRILFANDRAAQLTIQSNTAGHDTFTVLTRPEPGPKLPTGPGTGFPNDLRSVGAKFDYVLNPTRVIAGTVRDRATGKPLAGVQVAGWGPAYVNSLTDRDGRYRLQGLGWAKEYTIHAWPIGAATPGASSWPACSAPVPAWC